MFVRIESLVPPNGNICELEGRKLFYLTTHSTHFIYGYMVSDMVNDHPDGERKPAADTWDTLSD